MDALNRLSQARWSIFKGEVMLKQVLSLRLSKPKSDFILDSYLFVIKWGNAEI